MAGKKGMKWGKNKRKHSATVLEALKANEGRLPELMDDLYELATDTKASRKERMEALKFLIEKAAPKQAYEPSGQGIVWTADSLELADRMLEQAMREEAELIAEHWPELERGESGDKPIIEVWPGGYKIFDREGKILHERIGQSPYMLRRTGV